MFLNDWELDIKRGALAGAVGFCPDFAAMRFYNLLGYVESVTRGMHVNFERLLPSSAFGKEMSFISVHALVYSNTLW